jgi:competence protein ComEC
MSFLRKYPKEVVLAALLITNLLVWLIVFQKSDGKLLKVAFLDIGQGDAIFIESPSGKQMLIDGGKNKKIVSELGKIMPFGDRTIDIVLETHPDSDHIGGLPEVFARYAVELFIEPGVESESSLDEELHSRVAAEKSERLLARTGQVIDFGDGAKLVVLFPNRDVSNWETNDASVVTKLVYGDKSFLLTGDSGVKTENLLLGFAKEFLDVDVLQAGHHGSRTSTSLSFAQAASPLFGIISAGKDNTYGHPHIEVLNILNKVGAEIHGTAEEGTVVFETDGENLRLK